MAEIKGLVVAGVAMGGAEVLGLRPGGEGLSAFPHGVRSIEPMIVALGAAQQRKFDEAGTRSRWLSRESQTVSNAWAEFLEDIEAVDTDRILAKGAGDPYAVPIPDRYAR